MPVAGPIIGAVGAIGGGLLAAGGAKSAANTEAAAAAQGLAEQRREFDTNQQNYAPWLAAGKDALSQQLALLGLGGSSATPGQTDWAAYVNGNPDALANWNAVKNTSDGAQFGGDINAFGQYHYAADGSRRDLTPYTSAGTSGVSGADAQQQAITHLQQSPLYQSLFRNGQDTVLNNAAATGGLRGGNAQRSLYNLGSDTLAQVIQQQLANLGGISNTGNSSAGNLGQLNGQSANAMSNLFAAKGSAQAGGILGSAGVWNNAFNGVGKALGSSGLFNGAPTLGSSGIVAPTPGLVSNVGQTMNNNAGIF